MACDLGRVSDRRVGFQMKGKTMTAIQQYSPAGSSARVHPSAFEMVSLGKRRENGEREKRKKKE